MNLRRSIAKRMRKLGLKLLERTGSPYFLYEIPKYQRDELRAAGFQGQYGQDRYVWETWFKDKSDGVFVDIGAFDGKEYSNSWYFEKKLGWKGICIEPNPAPFVLLQQERECVCVNACIGDQKGKAKFKVGAGETAMLSGLVEHYDPRHEERLNQESKSEGAVTEIEVDVLRFSDVVRDAGIGVIDFLSLDTEGAELAILRSISFEETPVRVISVENNYDSVEFRKILQPKGFGFVGKLGCDDIYVRHLPS